MKKTNVLTIATGLALGLTLVFQPMAAKGVEVNSQPISDDFDVRPNAFDTQIGLNMPSTLRGLTVEPDISLSFSGDRNGNNEYRWTFTPGDGSRTQSGATGRTSQPIGHTYRLIDKDFDNYTVEASVTDIQLIVLENRCLTVDDERVMA